MIRKDCETVNRRASTWQRTHMAALRLNMPPATRLRQGSGGITRGMLYACTILIVLQPAFANAGQIRLWSSAVVVGNSIKLGDLAEIRDMDPGDEWESLRITVITEAPPAGGSRIIHHDMIRSALSAKGVNLAKISLSGSAQCEVRRPAAQQQAVQTPSSAIDGAATLNQPGGTIAVSAASQLTGQTLRQAVEEHFNKEFARYGGRAEVVFDRSDDPLLELTGPPLEFRIRREKSSPLGLCALEIELIRDGAKVQQTSLVVRTTMSRNVLTARRAINQGAAVEAADVDLMPVTFTRLDDLGLDDATLVLGQRAKRFVPAGTRIDLESLEPVPLVLRGQLITLTSEVGGVRVVTTGKAGANGVRGETIRVRSVDDNRVEFDAVVTGPGQARAAGGGIREQETKPRLVLGGG